MHSEGRAMPAVRISDTFALAGASKLSMVGDHGLVHKVGVPERASQAPRSLDLWATEKGITPKIPTTPGGGPGR